jgi:hypothetical protein
MAWYKFPLTKQQVGNGLDAKIQEQFQALFVASGQPKQMALFASKNAVDGIDLFLSPASLPAATDLIVQYGGVPCDKPKPEGLALLSGLQNSLDSLVAQPLQE